MGFLDVFVSLASLVAVIPVVTQAIKKIISMITKSEMPSWCNQLLSWIIGIALCMFAWIFDLGCLADANWWQSLIVGFGVSLAANGVFDIELVKWFLELLFGKLKKI